MAGGGGVDRPGRFVAIVGGVVTQDEADPLLVRPFVGESGSEYTWPAAPVPTPPASAADTAVLPSPVSLPPRRRRSRSRVLIVASTGIAAVLIAGAAGYAALRPSVGGPMSAGGDGAALPIVTGPASSLSVQPSPALTSSATHRAAQSTVTGTTGSTGDTAATAATAPPTTAAASAPGSASPGATSSPAATQQQVKPGASGAGNAQATDLTGVIRGAGGLCLDLNGGVPIDGNHVQVFDCNGSDAQRWTFATDGTLRVQGKCALIVGDDTVHIVSCDGRTTAQWQTKGAELVNAANHRCLTDPTNGNHSGTGVLVTRCTNATNQRWTFG
jgi:hypothetical protein